MVQALEEKKQTDLSLRAQVDLGAVLANSVAVGAVRKPELGLGAGQDKASTLAEQVHASGALKGLSGFAQNAQSANPPAWTSRITSGGDKTPDGGRGGR